MLGKSREGVGSDDPAYAEAFDVIDSDRNQHLLVGEFEGRVIAMLHLTLIPGLSTEAHALYGRLGFAATHEGFKRVLEEVA